ncbi:MAG: hypothetical protein Q9219_006092 [cf. Caloplaca sp. 3 TL-2023]
MRRFRCAPEMTAISEIAQGGALLPQKSIYVPLATHSWRSITLALIFFISPSTSAPPPSPNLSDSSNLTIPPWIQCAFGSRRLSSEALRECKSAIAFLPRYAEDVETFGPDVAEYPYRTPIISDHATRCTARVDIRDGFTTDRSSWRDVRAAFWELSAECLDQVRRVGMAWAGERHGLVLKLVYDFGRRGGAEGGVAGIGGGGVRGRVESGVDVE